MKRERAKLRRFDRVRISLHHLHMLLPGTSATGIFIARDDNGNDVILRDGRSLTEVATPGVWVLYKRARKIKVYVVHEHERYEGSSIKHVFTSKKKAMGYENECGVDLVSVAEVILNSKEKP